MAFCCEHVRLTRHQIGMVFDGRWEAVRADMYTIFAIRGAARAYLGF